MKIIRLPINKNLRLDMKPTNFLKKLMECKLHLIYITTLKINMSG